jgi:hypothetical protein
VVERNIKTVIPNPDPSAMTSEAIDRRVENSAAVINAELKGMEKAVNVFQSDLTRVPTQLDRAVVGLRDLIEARLCSIENRFAGLENLLTTKIDANKTVVDTRLTGMDKAVDLLQKLNDMMIPAFVREQVEQLKNLHNTKFEGVQTQFTLLKQATEQLDLANKTAIAAALQAQKESAGETQKSSKEAIAKSEASTSESIKGLTSTFSVAITGATNQTSDLKDRMTAMENRTAGITSAQHDSRESRTSNLSSGYYVVATIGAVVAVAVAGFSLLQTHSLSAEQLQLASHVARSPVEQSDIEGLRAQIRSLTDRLNEKK